MDCSDLLEYRAWNKIDKKMIHSGVFVEDGDVGAYDFDPEYLTVQQRTVLTDVNGKTVFFDDIVRFKSYEPDDEVWQHGTAVVYRTMTGGAGLLYDIASKGDDHFYAVLHGGVINDVWEDPEVWQYEVIGNIYENPELILEPNSK